VDFSHYSDQAMTMAVDLVNTLERVTGEDELSDLEGLVTFLATYENEWHGVDRYPDPTSVADLEEVRRLRERLRAVFEAQNRDVAAKTLNAILADTEATPRISTHLDHPHMHFEPLSGGVAKWLGAAAAMGLSTVLVENGLDRFGVCAANDCVDAYIDTSKNRSRRHCSTTCSNREHVAAHRKRTKAKSASKR